MEDLLCDVLECSVCLNQLDSTARVLPCQHTFCYGCLSDIARSHKEVLCPECRVLVTVPIDQLPSNILLIRILEGIKNRPNSAQQRDVSQQKSAPSTSVPTTTDYSYILKLYDQPGITSFSGGPASSTLPNLSTADDTSTVLQPSTSDVGSSSMFAVGSALPRTASTNSSLNSLTSSSSVNTDFIPACSLSSISNSNSLNPFFNASFDSCIQTTVSSSPVPFLSNEVTPSPPLQQMSALSLSGSSMASTSQSPMTVTSTQLLQQNFHPIQTLTSRASSFSPSLAECQMTSSSSSAHIRSNGFTMTFPHLQSPGSLLQTSLPPYSSASVMSKNEGTEILTYPALQSGTALLPQQSNISASSSTAVPPLQSFSATIASGQTVPILSNQTSVSNISNIGQSLGSVSSFNALPTVSGASVVFSSSSTSSSTDNILCSLPSLNTGMLSSNTDGMSIPATMSQTAPNSRSITPVFGANSTFSAQSLAVTPSVGSLLARPAVKPQLTAPVFARALFNYTGNEERDLSLQKGSIVTLLRVVDSNWVVGECGGRQGYFPSSYVQLLPSDSLPQAVALYDFKLPDSSVGHAAGCLTFTKGAVLSVSRRVDHNWAEGCVAGRKGIFPVSFVQLNAAAAALLQVNPLTTATSTTTTTTAAVADASRTPVSRPTESIANVTPSDFNTASLPRSSSSSLPARTSSSTDPRGLSRASVGNLNDDLPPLTIPANAGLPSSAPKTGANNMAMLYVARFPYTPQKSDEVALTKGGLYAVTQRCHDGWFKGRCLTTHKTGVFPGNYLQPARGQTIADYIARLNNKGPTSPPSDSSSTGDAGGGSAADSPVHAPAVRRTVSAGVATPASPVAGGDSSPHHLPHISRVSSASSLGSPASLFQKKEPASVRLTAASPVSSAGVQPPPSSLLQGPASATAAAAATQPAPLLKERCRCVVAFPASTPRELALSVGDIVYVLQRPTSRGDGEEGDGDGGGVAEGWLYGLLLSTGKSGLFPSTFVEPF